jgi:hypothetical protein
MALSSSNKKVIFVAGTSYSGTTFLHLILANCPQGMAVGEFRWLFNPARPYHLSMRCGCGNPDCRMWQQFKRGGERLLFPNVFRNCPEVDLVVDSSKEIFWIQRQLKHLSESGISAKNVLIWKRPEEFQVSVSRRPHSRPWQEIWIDYHRLYFSIVPEWRAIPYADFVSDSGVLRAACEYLEIEYFDLKTHYWEKIHHIFGGNPTGRYHLYTDERAKSELQGTFDESRMRLHRTIYYSTPEANAETALCRIPISQRHMIERIVKTLAQRDVRITKTQPIDAGFGFSSVLARRLVYESRRLLYRARFMGIKRIYED